jgi:threonine/homoserine/homoserine lactone efflux protein
MFPTDTLIAYISVALLVAISPDPDSILVISRGL